MKQFEKKVNLTLKNKYKTFYISNQTLSIPPLVIHFYHFFLGNYNVIFPY